MKAPSPSAVLHALRRVHRLLARMEAAQLPDLAPDIEELVAKIEVLTTRLAEHAHLPPDA